MKKAAFDQAKADQCEIEMYPVQISEADLRTKVLEVVKSAKKTVDLVGADIIVAVGMGISKDVEKGKQLAEELAEALDLTVNQVSNIENGVSFPRMGSFLKICSVLQASPDYFLSGTIHHNISENICDMLSLCSVEEQQIIWLLLDTFLHRNSKKDLEKQ